jgi:hypothetical protein
MIDDLLQHYRDVAPHLLHKKQRGRMAAMAGDVQRVTFDV